MGDSSTATHAENKSQAKPETVHKNETGADAASLAALEQGLFNLGLDGRMDSQAARLSDPRLRGAQRQALAGQIERTQGNRHLQRLVQTAIQRQTPETQNASPFAPTLGPSLLAPDTDARGVAYEVPGQDYRKDTVPNTPPLDAPMPLANIKQPEAIPGWKITIPPKTIQLGPFSYTESSGTDYVVTEHSAMIKSAWDSYRFRLIPDVQNAWNNAVPILNNYTQMAKGDPDLQQVTAEMKSKWNMGVGPGQGTVTAGVGGTQVSPGVTVGGTIQSVAAAGDSFQKGLQDTAAAQPGDSAGTPVQQARLALQGKQDEIKGKLITAKGIARQLEGSTLRLEGFAGEMKVRELEKEKEGLEAEKKAIENGSATLKRIDPELARCMLQIRSLAEPLKGLPEVVKAAEKGDEAGAAWETAKTVMEVIKWEKTEEVNKQIESVVDGIRSTLEKSSADKYYGERQTLDGLILAMKGNAQELNGLYEQEKALYDTLARVVQANWKGNPAEGALAANALKAIPLVHNLLRYLDQLNFLMPKLPDPDFNADKGYALAKDGVAAPGVADFLQAAGWLMGAQGTIGIEKIFWTVMSAQLDMVGSKLGLQ